MKRFATTAAACLAMLIALVGCGKVPDPVFRPNLVQLAANNISEDQRFQIADILEALYGTPNDPYVLPETGLDLQKITMAAGRVRSDETGAKLGLFREHCAHCHGITGDGMGPTAAFLKPYPRDYRQGLYKFKSTPGNFPPTHDDLMRILNEGITGTAMPSFKLLAKEEVEALAEYVKYLSFRGQTELGLIKYVAENLGDKDKVPTTHEVLVGQIMQDPNTGLVAKWQKAPQEVTQIPKPPANLGSRESIELGKKIFYETGGCVKCHGPTALGDGQKVADLWNEPIEKLKAGIPGERTNLDKQEAEVEKKLSDSDEIALIVQNAIDEAKKKGETIDGDKFKQELIESLDKSLDKIADDRVRLDQLADALKVAALPPRLSDPRNLRQGIFRGGRERFEIFYRLHNGVFASAMPGIATTPGITPDDIWHVVDYVLALPYEPGSQYAPEAKAPPRDRL